MSVKIRIKGNDETAEYKDALALKEIFEKEFSKRDTNGEILIISNATLFGQETKDVDLIVLGSFDKYYCNIKSKATTLDHEELELKERRVWVNDFCFVIESKRHRAEDIQLNGLQLLVKYNDKLSDVTTQSENQKYSLLRYFQDRINFSPFICNFIWFQSISWESIKDLLGDNENVITQHNYLPTTFTFPFLMQLACVQRIPFNAKYKDGQPKPSSSFNCLRRKQEFDFNEMDSVFDLFQRVKNGTGQLTRKKIEHITKKLLDQQQFAQGIGERLVIISGRAGTGKTIKLLRIACDLATNHGLRNCHKINVAS